MIDPRLLADIKRAERCVLTAYKDSRGFWTIGWGHLLDQSKDWTGHTISQDSAGAILDADVTLAATATLRTSEWPFLDTACRQNAVIELVFNMGAGKWPGFVHCRQAIQAHDWQGAHDQLLNSAWANEVHATRANRLANYFLTGQYPTE